MKTNKIFSILLFALIFFLLQCASHIKERGGSYFETTNWHSYQKYLPNSLRYDEMSLPKEEYWKWKGNQIHLDRYSKKSASCKVILVHGGGGNGRLLMPLAKLVTDNANCDVVSPDFPGYGLSVVGNDTTVSYDLWVEMLSDLIDKEREDGKKIFVFGLSIGGMLSYHAVAKNKKVDGLIVTTLADLRDHHVRDTASANLFLSRVGIPLNNVFSWFTDPIHVPIKWLTKMDLITNDPKFSSEFESDPYAGGGKVSFRFLRTLMNYEPDVEPENFDICPVLLAHPGLDPWTPLELSKKFYDKLKSPKQLVVLTGAGHFPYEEPGLSILRKSISGFLK
ncbi:MAG: alpha/beta hydrolase [Leptospira sp.]|nr:alpha/beta hydrolase [Leptospira sp.]